ncbi:DEKNAAC102517 [Brettanomyces naardenensis]|uniref:DEKNAAC102517 n=1 Tax=Brettanomyces naardenensis TaxID=13370 RepID=A0A448YKX8_BRENA|nr:DEKNAAC102517 [Brettanomyces naardenensis]
MFFSKGRLITRAIQANTIMYIRNYSSEAPKLSVRWFYATDIPTTKPTDRTYIQKEEAKKFLPFAELDSRRIEAQFQEYCQDKNEKLQKVPVNEDQLFDCDLKLRLLKPAFWNGPSYEVRRGTWFLDGDPVPEAVADQLEEAYDKVKPYLRHSLVDDSKSDDFSVRYDTDCHIVAPSVLYKQNNGKEWPFEDPSDLTCHPKEAVFTDSRTAVLLDEEVGMRKILVDAFMKTKGRGIMGGYCLKRGYDYENKKKSQKKKEEDAAKAAPPVGSDKTPEKATNTNLAMEMVQSIKRTIDYELSDQRFQADMEGDFSNDPSKLEDSGEREVDHLVLCIHGVGQSLSSRYSGVNFAHDCNNLRRLLKSLFAKDPEKYATLAYPENTDLHSETVKNCKVQVLPIIWRYDIDFSWDHVYQEFAKDGSLRLPMLRELNVDGATPLRTLAADVVLDILLYYEPNFKTQILSSVVKSANSLYDKYKERHPNFKGKISLCGHSLGSVIAMDLLCLQPGTIPKGKDFNPAVHLKFPVENYFGMGSPNGVFKLMKRQNVRPRSEFQEPPLSEPLAFIEGNDMSPKVNNVYNIFYPTDIVAYRMEPLVHTEMAKYKPKAIEFADKNNFNSKIQSLTSLPAGILDNDVVRSVFKMTGMDAQYERALSAASSAIESDEKELKLPELANKMMHELNKNGRIDYCLPQGYFEIDLINALGSHTQYLSDPNVASFLLTELWSKGAEKIVGAKVDEEKETQIK